MADEVAANAVDREVYEGLRRAQRLLAEIRAKLKPDQDAAEIPEIAVIEDQIGALADRLLAGEWEGRSVSGYPRPPEQ